MDLSKGFDIEKPAVNVPWSVSQAGLGKLLGPKLQKVAHGYYTLPVVSCGGLRHVLGFHFEDRHGDRLTELQLFRGAPMPIAESYPDFQTHLEKTFGPPNRSSPGEEGFPTYEWALQTVRIVHLVQGRFDLEEQVRIQSLPP